MHRRRRQPAAVVLAAAALAVAGAGHGAVAAPAPIPSRVFAPYFETYTSDNPAFVARASSAKYLTLAFLQAPAPGSCAVYWDGSTSAPVSWADYGADIAAIRAAGGNVAVSFGGYGADHSGQDIADACPDAAKVAAVYEDVVSTYGVGRLDLDVEDRSLADTAGVQRRNRAVRMVERWAAAQGLSVQFVYTLPGELGGPGRDERAMLADARRQGALISIVNFMTFDYPVGAKQDMARDTETAASRLEEFLSQLHPRWPARRLWAMVGVTEMIGVDDAGKAQTFTPADGRRVERWAARTGIAELSFWALERDNGSCPGFPSARGDCSGLAQAPWQFSREFARFTR